MAVAATAGTEAGAMTSEQPGAEGDYTYDLAHDADTRPRTAHKAAEPEGAHPEPSASGPPPDGDYGYDEAHGY